MYRYLITGTNRGIGLELCKQLKTSGHEVIATCRKPSSELQALDIEIIEDIDINSQKSINKIVQQLSDKKIDVLVNNSGVWGDEKLGEFSSEKIASVILTNAISPLLVTEALIGSISANGKVIMITSRKGSIADNSTGGRYSYRMSKAALNAAARSLSIDLKDKGIIVGLIHPGHVATDMGGPNGIPIHEAVSNILKRIEEYSLENTGEFKHANGETLPW